MDLTIQTSTKRKRTYSDNFNENANKINDSDKIFDYKYYLELIEKTYDETYREYQLFKSKALSIHYQDNNVIRFQEDSYVKDETYQNIKIQLDGFDEDGNLIYIIPFCHNINEIKINNVSQHYIDYIQIILNILKLEKCIVYVYSFETYSNPRDIRRNKRVKKDKYGWIIDDDADIYYTLQHVRTNVIKKEKINMRKISTINGQIMGMNVDKYTTPVHKKKKNNFLDPTWIAASKTRNASLNDHFIDYCRVYNVRDIDDIPEKRKFNFDPSSKYEREGKLPHQAHNFIDFLLTSGNHFESKIIEKIQSKYPNDFVKVCDSFESRNINNFKKTLYHMNKGVPLIHQAVLYNYEHKVFGSGDLLVRSDWLNKLVSTNVITKKQAKIKASKLKDAKYHYRIIDIKFHKFHLNVDKKTLRNNAGVRPFKSQLAIYNMALAEMQGYEPPHSYILGKGWILNRTVNKKKITNVNNNPFNKFGIIDFKDRDKGYLTESLEHIDWLRELDESTDWTHDPPSNDRLYPNMCNQMDGIYGHVKKQVAEKYKELTQIWSCSHKNRSIGFSNGIKSWDDPNCSAKTLGITGDVKPKFVDKMISFQRDSNMLVSVQDIKHNHGNWRNTNNKIDIYIDFETIGSTLLESHKNSTISNSKNSDYIFMIGIGWQVANNEKWNYKCLYTNDISVKEEIRVLTEMNGVLDYFEKTTGINNIYHWSNAEPKFYEKANEKYDFRFNKKIKWFDLCKFFKTNNIFIRGAHNFSLKTIASKMCENDMIESDWQNLNCSNGLDAMFNAWKLYVNGNEENKEQSIFETDLYQEIIDYNEIDCKTLFEILNYLRKYH